MIALAQFNSRPNYSDRAVHMVRSAFIISIAAGLLAAPLAALSQQPQKVFRVGFLAAGGRTPDAAPPGLLRGGLRSLGYVEGQNISYEARFAEAKAERLPGLAADLVRLKVDLIVTQGWRASMAAKQATSTIPIVMALPAGDAVATGLIASLARPGGNVTGMTDESVLLSAKRIELLKEAVPKAARIAIIWNEDDLGMTLRYRGIEEAARVLNFEVLPLGVRSPEEFPRAFSEMTRRRPDALFLVADALTVMNRKQVIEFAATQRIPAMYEVSSNVRDGGLMSYGPSPEDSFRRTALYIDRILKGAKPADLPAEQPTRYYLAINLKTAAALGLTLPPVLRLRADDVIE